MDFHHLGEFVFSRNVCVSRRKVPVFGTFSAYSASSAALRENPNEEPSIADMSLRKPTARASSLRSGRDKARPSRIRFRAKSGRRA